MKTIRVVAAVIKAVNENGEPIIFATLTIEDAMTASEIAEAVGCTYQKVALWGSRVLAKKGLINIEKRGGKTVYFDNEEADEN